MKKIVVLLTVIALHSSLTSASDHDQNHSIAFTSGYVFKHDDALFKQIYGYGMGNLITIDSCYQFKCSWWLGTKLSVWFARGHTPTFKRRTTLTEVPLTFYLGKSISFDNCLQLYAALGGGVTWINENSYLGNAHTTKGIGEVEAGLFYPISCHVNFTSAFRYLFPRQKQNKIQMDPGGFDLRAGIEVPF